MRCALYCRISDDRSGEGLGIERQLADCRDLVTRRGGTVVGEFLDNSRSATTGRRRPEYERLLAAVESGTVDTVVAWALDRLVRRTADLERLIELCDRHRVAILLVRGSDLDLSTPSGRMVAGMLGTVARYEVDAKSDRQRRESRQRADRGLPPGGRRPFGYRGVEVVEDEAEAVRGAYGMLLDGCTLTSIKEALDERFPSTAGGNWTVTGVRSMLLNPRYVGQRWHLGSYVGPGAWPAIVDEATWEAARTLLATPGRKAEGGNVLRWLGSGYYVCGRCKVDVPMKASYRGILARGTQARIYKCPECFITRVAEPIDRYVSLVAVEYLRRPDLVGLLAKPDVDLKPLQVEAKNLRDRRKAIPRMFALGTLTEAEATETRQIIDDRLGEISALFAGAAARPALAEVLSAPDPGAAWLARNVQRQQAVLRELITVRLLPVGPGRRPFDPASVDIKPED
jgi:site-specific DNA recombinase